jgi:hypothetical protein
VCDHERLIENDECRCPTNKYLNKELECVTSCELGDVKTKKCTTHLTCANENRVAQSG